MCDWNHDGRESIADAVLMCRIFTEDSTLNLTNVILSALDINHDGVVSLLDLYDFMMRITA